MSIDPIGIRISGPLAGLAEGYGTELAQLGYAPASVRLQMKVFADLSDWLLSHGMAAADLRRSDLDRFLRHRRATGHTRYASIRAVHPVLDYLQGLKVVPRQAPDAILGPVDVMLDRFWRYLTVERALAAVTARAYLDMVRPFVQGRLSADCRAFERLTAADIICFVVTRCPRQSRGAAKLTVTALRSFLRFLHLDGVIEASLVSAVPSVAGRRLVGLPKGLAPDQVRRLFASCDDTTRRGCRDIAILTMLVRLGMRSGEVAKLRLDDIDWRAGEIIVRGKANSIERIPLPPDVGRAVAACLAAFRGNAIAAGIDTSVIALWLGHENIETTQVYLHADLAIKERALARTKPAETPPGRFRPTDKLLAFLEAL